MRMRKGFTVCGSENNLFQSFGFESYRSLGSDTLIFEHLERHGVDELLIVSPISNPIYEPYRRYNFDGLEKMYVGIPVIVGGEMSDSVVSALLEKGCVERFMFSGSLQDNQNKVIDKVTREAGRQAVLGCLALRVDGDQQIWLFENSHQGYRKLKSYDIDRAYDICDEVIFQDMGSYGRAKHFSYDAILRVIRHPNRSILNGGIDPFREKLASKAGIAAVYYDNTVMHSENR